MSEKNAVVAIYESHSQAEEALKELQRSGFDMKKLSIIGKDYHTEEHVVGYYNAGDRMRRALEGAVVVGGLSAIGAGLYSIGVPKNSIVQYESAIKSDKFLLLAHGTQEEVERAKGIMQTAQPVEITVHDVRQQETVGAVTR
jgi:hypothetical protein